MSTPEPEVVTSYLDRETSLGRMVGVKEESKPIKKIHISSMEMIPKKADQASGDLLWTCPHQKVRASMTASVQHGHLWPTYTQPLITL